MLDSINFDEIATNLSKVLPESLRGLDKELQEKFKHILTNTFDKLDLVTREEFDTQKKVLAKTREKVEQLEEQLSTILSQRKE